jgi:hypothetical protein
MCTNKYYPDLLNYKNAIVLSFLLILLLCFGIRILPYLTHQYKFEVGYDTGIYEYLVEKFTTSESYPISPGYPPLAEHEIKTVTWFMEPGFFNVVALTNKLMGLDTQRLFRYFLPFLASLFSLSILYLMVKRLSQTRIKETFLLAGVLFAFSYLQYNAINESYYKQIFGILILLLYVYSLDMFLDTGNKRFLYPLILFGSILIAYHRPETFLLALILGIYFIAKIFTRHYRTALLLLLAGIGIAAISSVIWIPRLDAEITVLKDSLSMTISPRTPGGATPHLYQDYDNIMLAYFLRTPLIPLFGVIGLILVHRQKLTSPFITLLYVLFVLIIFQFIFYNRFLMVLDIVLLPFTAIGVRCAIRDKSRAVGIITIALIIVIMLSSAFSFQYNKKPYVWRNEEGIEWIKQNIPKENSVIFAPDYISVILKSQGYRVGFYDDSLTDKQVHSQVRNEQILVEGYNPDTILKYYDLSRINAYFVWGSWDETHPLPLVNKKIPSEKYHLSNQVERIYEGRHEIRFIYRLKEPAEGQ